MGLLVILIIAIFNYFIGTFIPPSEEKRWKGVVGYKGKFEPVHEISNNVVCATCKASDQPAHKRSLIRAFASRLSIL